MNKFVVVILIVALAAGGYFFVTNKSTTEDKMEETSMTDTTADSMMEDEDKMMDDDSMMEDDSMMDSTTPADEMTVDSTAPVDEMMVDDGSMTEEDSATEETDMVVVEVEGGSFYFDPDEVTVTEGDTVKIVFTNVDGTHDWVIDEFDARTPIIQEGETSEITFVADQSGSFEYYCSVGNHREMGMVGTLVVEPLL